MEFLAVLALLACPLGMGAMMWFMGKGMKHGNTDSRGARAQPKSVEQLLEERRRLEAEIASRERDLAESGG